MSAIEGNKTIRLIAVAVFLLLTTPLSAEKNNKDDTSDLPKASPDATEVIIIQSNKDMTSFYVDGTFVVSARQAKILVNKKAHTIEGRLEGYKSKQIYIQPPYAKGQIFGFTFLNEDRVSGSPPPASGPPPAESSDAPPVVVISSPRLEKGRDIKLQSEEAPKPFEIKGRVSDDKGLASVKINGEKVNLNPDGTFTYTAYLREGENKFFLEAVDTGGNKTIENFSILGQTRGQTPASSPAGAPPSPPNASLPNKLGPKPSLWVLAMGVSQYKDPQLNLKWADADAIELANAFKQQKGKLFSEVLIKTLVNEQATRANIMMAISEHLGKAGPEDVVMIFVAGHGVKSQQTGSYYFVTYNADLSNMIVEGLKWSDFDEAVKILSNNVNKVILILDTCHSGAMHVSMRSVETGEDLTQALSTASGVYTLAASKAGESSLEYPEYGHGAFTWALLKGLKGEANYDSNNYISLIELFSYVAKTVPLITNGKQHPHFEVSGTDLPIAQIK